MSKKQTVKKQQTKCSMEKTEVNILQELSKLSPEDVEKLMKELNQSSNDLKTNTDNNEKKKENMKKPTKETKTAKKTVTKKQTKQTKLEPKIEPMIEPKIEPKEITNSQTKTEEYEIHIKVVKSGTQETTGMKQQDEIKTNEKTKPKKVIKSQETKPIKEEMKKKEESKPKKEERKKKETKSKKKVEKKQSEVEISEELKFEMKANYRKSKK